MRCRLCVGLGYRFILRWDSCVLSGVWCWHVLSRRGCASRTLRVQVCVHLASACGLERGGIHLGLSLLSVLSACCPSLFCKHPRLSCCIMCVSPFCTRSVSCTCILSVSLLFASPGYRTVFSQNSRLDLCSGSSLRCEKCSSEPGTYCLGGSDATTRTCTCSAGYYSNSLVSGGCAGTGGSCGPCPVGHRCAGGGAQPVACTCRVGWASTVAGSSLGCNDNGGTCNECATEAAQLTVPHFCSGGSAQPRPCRCSPGPWLPCRIGVF